MLFLMDAAVTPNTAKFYDVSTKFVPMDADFLPMIDTLLPITAMLFFMGVAYVPVGDTCLNSSPYLAGVVSSGCFVVAASLELRNGPLRAIQHLFIGVPLPPVLRHVLG